MIIYNYLQDNIVLVVLIIAVVTLLVALLFVSIFSMKKVISRISAFKEKLRKTSYAERMILAVPSVIAFVLVITLICGLSNQTYFIFKCITGNYEYIVGEIEITDVIRNDYRDTELYDITFNVDEVKFVNIVNSFSKEQKDELSSCDAVAVKYVALDDEIIIFEIINEEK